MSERLIQQYESAAKVMQQMLLAARNDAWEKVSELEQTYMRMLETIQQDERTMKQQGVAVAPTIQSRKQALIQQILADDGEIRYLLYPVMHQMTDLIFDAQLHARLPPDLG